MVDIVSLYFNNLPELCMRFTSSFRPLARFETGSKLYKGEF